MLKVFALKSLVLAVATLLVNAQIPNENDVTPPEAASIFPAPGAVVRALSQVEITFSEDVLGIDAVDLLVNGETASRVTQAAGAPFIFQFPPQPPGQVRFTWAANHGITDAAMAPNPFGGGGWTNVVNPSFALGDVIITEALAANVKGLADEEQDLDSWIEIYNRGATAVNLENWSLSDDPDLPSLWTFPARTLGPGEFLVVFASGKNRKPTASTSKLHTNFKLSNQGEHLGLYTPDSPRVLSSGFTPLPEQRNDISYGLDAAGRLRYFSTPTPGASNGVSSIQGVCAPVHVNVNRGHFNTPFDLILSSPTPGVHFRYTTNGSEPTIESPVFPASLRITRTTLFRAAAFKENYLPSKTVTHSYLFNLAANLRSLPVISVVTASNHLYGRSGIIGINGGNYNSGVWTANPGATNDFHNPSKHGIAWERPTSVEWIVPEDNSGFQVDCGIRVQGSDYQRPRLTRTSKFSFRLYFRGDYGPGRLDYPLFPISSVPRFDQLVLRAGFNEQGNPFIRDEIHRRLSHDMGQVASHGNLAIVLVNGVAYTGSPWYNPCERVHEEFMQEHLGGGDEWDVVGPSFATSAGTPGVIDGDRANFQSMVTYVTGQRPTNPAVYLEVERRLDLTNFVDYCLLNAYAAMGDWPANNWRAGRERTTNGVWRFVVWDAEWGMGIYDRTVNINCFTQTGGGPNDSGLGSVGSSEIARIYDRMRSSYDFRLLWADRVHKHFFNGGALTGGNITNRFEELRAQMRPLIPSMETEILLWARDRQRIFFNHMTPYGLLLSSNAPGFNQFGGRVQKGFQLVITNATGPIYYTTDGTDPRVRFTSEVSSTAKTYTAPIPLDTTVTVRARSLLGTNWSAAVEATFTAESLGVPVRISEIMYNPTGGALFEYLELQNTSGTALDLSRMYFDGITFVFKEGSSIPGGGRIVLAANTDTNAWMARYPGVSPYGWYGGSLNNGGERLALLDPKGAIITSVDFKEKGAWPAEADLSGRSLEAIDPEGNPDDPANWMASSAANGTPGAANSVPPAATVVINELMADNVSAVPNGGAFPDWIELWNSTAATVNLAGWSLTDDDNRRKFVFPTGTTLPASGHLVVWGDSATNQAGLHLGFSLERNGESLSLYDASTNRVDAVTFGLQLPNYSIGRVSGAWTLTDSTPNAANIAARLGASTNLALNEWMANPAPGDNDWVEVFNASTEAPVSLQGIYVGVINIIQRLNSLSFIAPGSFVQLFADDGVGADHLDVTLPATGGRLTLYDATGAELQRITYPAQTNGVSQGRLPDGSANIALFRGTASPGASNYTNNYTGPVLNEVLVRNRSLAIGGAIADYIELHNPGSATFDLGGMSLSLNRPEAGEWIFPIDTELAPNGYLLLICDGSRPATNSNMQVATNAPARLVMGESLDDQSGGVYLFGTNGQLVNSLEYGFQIEDRPIGLLSGQWQLLSAATPGAANAPAAELGATSVLRLNEWMADPLSGPDWFEVYNPGALPVSFAAVSLTDDPSLVGRGQFRPAPLTFIAPQGHVKWIADNDPGDGRNHVNFNLDAEGDIILLYTVAGTNYTLIDAVAWGVQALGVSLGSYPDGSTSIIGFAGSATPGAPNSLGADQDGDGLPDAIERQFGLNPENAADGALDADGDGMSNAHEFLAGTDIRDASSSLQIDRIALAGAAIVSFNAAPNRTYTVLYKDSLNSPVWSKLSDVLPRPTEETVSIIDSQSPAASRFYRLLTPASR